MVVAEAEGVVVGILSVEVDGVVEVTIMVADAIMVVDGAGDGDWVYGGSDIRTMDIMAIHIIPIMIPTILTMIMFRRQLFMRIQPSNRR